MRRGYGVLMIIILSAAPAWAQWAVIDAADIAQNTTTALNSSKQVYNSSQQVINEYNEIRNQIEQIANQVKNLQRIPKGLNFLDDITMFGNKIDGLMSQATGISFELTQATGQFDRLYRQAASVTSTADVLALRQKL